MYLIKQWFQSKLGATRTPQRLYIIPAIVHHSPKVSSLVPQYLTLRWRQPRIAVRPNWQPSKLATAAAFSFPGRDSPRRRLDVDFHFTIITAIANLISYICVVLSSKPCLRRSLPFLGGRGSSEIVAQLSRCHPQVCCMLADARVASLLEPCPVC